MKTLAKLQHGLSRAVKEALETWKADHDEAMAVRDLEEVIRVCVDLDAYTRKFVRSAWEMGLSGEADDSEEIGRDILKGLEEEAETWQALSESAAECAARGYTVEGADRIPTTLAEVRALRNDFASRWPFVRAEDVGRGVSEIAAGKFVTAEELLCELHGQGG